MEICYRIQAPENGTAPPWHDYFLCGVKGIFDEYLDCDKRGMLVIVSGNIPPAAGLSSSSALVSSSALATSLINEVCHENLLSVWRLLNLKR